MFEQVSAVLDRAIGELEIPVDGAALKACIALRDRLDAKIACAVGEFDDAEGWKETGATSMTAWLRHQTERSARDAAVLTKTGRRLCELPVTAAAYRDGVLSSGQVQAIVANLNDKIVSQFADLEHDLVPCLAQLDVRNVSVVMQQWAQAAKDTLDDPEPAVPERSLYISKTLGGRRELSGSLDPEGGALTELALRLAATRDAEGEPERTPAHRRADALVGIMRWFLDHHHDQPAGRHRPHLNVFMDQDDLPCQGKPRPATDSEPLPDLAPYVGKTRSAWLPDGTILDSVTIDRLACDCALHRIVHAGRSSILDYGTATRTAPDNLFNAVMARDHTCRYPGCDRPASWCEAHHPNPWENGGTTSITNLVLLCSRHHHLVHSPGWHNKLLADGTYEVTNPKGDTYTTVPPGRPPDLLNPRPPPQAEARAA